MTKAFLLAACLGVLMLVSACGEGASNGDRPDDNGGAAEGISWIDIAPADFALDGYIAPGLMYAIYQGDYEMVPDDRITRSIVFGLTRALNGACGETRSFDVLAYMGYAGTPTDPSEIALDILEGIVAARDSAEQGDLVGGVFAFYDELGLPDIAPKGVADGSLLVNRHGCESTQVPQFRLNLNTVVVSRADKKPTLNLDPLVPLLSQEYKARYGIADVLQPGGSGDERQDTGPIEPLDVSVSPSLGTMIEYGQVPDRFIPEIPDMDSLEPRLLAIEMEKPSAGALIRIRIMEFSIGGHGPQSTVFYYQGAARTIVQEDYTALANSGALIMECTYNQTNQGLDSVATFWYGATPSLADPDRLHGRLENHPVLWIKSDRDSCPGTQIEAADAS